MTAPIPVVAKKHLPRDVLQNNGVSNLYVFYASLTILHDREAYGTKYDSNDRKLTGNLCQKFNNRLVYSPSEHTMAYAIRDPVFNSTFPQMLPRGFADKVTLKSRCYDAHLVIDGGMSYVFNHGSKAVLEMREEDALKTVVFR